jgi:hypothetical protein
MSIMETAEYPPFVPVAAFTSVHEAQLARSVLDAAGIPAVLENEHVISMNWTYSNAVGGVRVVVPADQLDEARALLTTEAVLPADALEDVESHVSATDHGDSCRQCGSDAFESVLPVKPLAVLTWLTLGVPFGTVVRRRHCRRCGAVADREQQSAERGE